MKNIMKLFLYAALPLALIALGSCSYPKNITFKADSQTGALSGLYLTSDTSMKTGSCVRMEHNTNGWTPGMDGDWDIFG
jgi:cyanate permease